jgi:hypothetical protein
MCQPGDGPAPRLAVASELNSADASKPRRIELLPEALACTVALKVEKQQH